MKKRILCAVMSYVILITCMTFNILPAAAVGIEIMNFDYDDTVGFNPLGNAKVEISSDFGHSGERSVKVSSRKVVSDGAVIDIEKAAEPTSYNATVWVYSQTPCKITAELGGKKVNSANALANSWTKLSGKVSIDNNDKPLKLEIYTISGIGDFYIDDVSVLEEGQQIATPYVPEGINMIENADFEEGNISPFAARSATVNVSEASAHNGKYGASITERTQGWQGIEIDIKDMLVQNANYEMSAWLRLDDSSRESADFYAQLEISEPGADTYYPEIRKLTVKSGEWVEFRGMISTRDLQFPVNGLKLYFASADNNVCDFSVDDVFLAYTTKTAAQINNTGANPWVNKELIPLKDVYKDHFLVGTAAGGDFVEDPVRDEMISYHFNVITAGNEMKPTGLENTKGRFTWNIADRIVEQAHKRDMDIHGHVLVWHEQTPGWMNYEGMSREEALQNLRDYIFTVMEHYKGQCMSWDVVNEAIDGITDTSTVSGILRDAPWRRAIGDDYIEYAFRFAAEADPTAKLYYNDYNLDDAKKADAVVTLVKDLQSKGIKIDGIGMQGHYSTSTSAQAVENSIKKFAELGVSISISELDICHYGASEGVLTEEQEIEQAQKYAQLFRIYKKYSDVIERVTFWGFDDESSWRADGMPLPFDRDFQAKEAYYAILDPDKYLEEHPISGKITTHGIAYRGTPTIDGVVEELWNDVPAYNVNRYVMAWQGAKGTIKTLWDENNLYVLFDVSDGLLSTTAGEVYMQDSVEIFVDENNAKTTYYEENNDAQYRVSCENEVSFGSGAIADKFKTATVKTASGYMVEMAIPFHTPRTGTGIIGFDAQINDDSSGNGNRTSVAKFNDMTDNSWGNTENWGEMFLTEHGECDDILVSLNGRTLSFDVSPTIINDRTMVPFRTIFEELGAQVEYDENGKYITAVHSDKIIKMQIDNVNAEINGEGMILDAAPVIIDGRTLVPIRFVSEALGTVVKWNDSTRTVSIITE